MDRKRISIRTEIDDCETRGEQMQALFEAWSDGWLIPVDEFPPDHPLYEEPYIDDEDDETEQGALLR